VCMYLLCMYACFVYVCMYVCVYVCAAERGYGEEQAEAWRVYVCIMRA
jgi:hypothetical protein